jgi:fumarate hydratase class II
MKRIEKDTLGEVEVPEDKLYGAQTQRSIDNFTIGFEKMPIELIHAIALIKKASAKANLELRVLSQEHADSIIKAVDKIYTHKYDDHFPLLVWQTGSGTQTNMNVNEVIANLSIQEKGGKLGSKDIHPNDHVNKSQSSNDVFPSAMHISARLMIEHRLLPALQKLREGLNKKANEFKDIVKIGRTHLMDATPITLGQEFSGYVSQIDHDIQAIKNTFPHLEELALGGTAVGTGINAPPNFDKIAIKYIVEETKIPFKPAPNKFEALASNDTMVELSGALKRTAVSFMKIANDIRWMGSGPRSGLGELILPSNEPGSSIMPGKVNPTQSEAMTQVSIQVLGNDASIGFAGSLGNFELNVFKPVIIYNVIQSIRLLSDVAISFTDKCLTGLEPNRKKIEEYLNRSLMLATALNNEIGYDKAALVVKKAYAEDITLKEAAVSLGFIDEKRFDEIVDPKKMIH